MNSRRSQAQPVSAHDPARSCAPAQAVRPRQSGCCPLPQQEQQCCVNHPRRTSDSEGCKYGDGIVQATCKATNWLEVIWINGVSGRREHFEEKLADAHNCHPYGHSRGSRDSGAERLRLLRFAPCSAQQSLAVQFSAPSRGKPFLFLLYSKDGEACPTLELHAANCSPQRPAFTLTIAPSSSAGAQPYATRSNA